MSVTDRVLLDVKYTNDADYRAHVGCALQPVLDFLARLDEMTEQAFDDQCTGANPRYPLMSEIKDMYLKCYYGN